MGRPQQRLTAKPCGLCQIEQSLTWLQPTRPFQLRFSQNFTRLVADKLAEPSANAIAPRDERRSEPRTNRP